MTRDNSEKWMTAGEVAQKLNIPRKKVYRLIHEEDLPATKISERTYRFAESEIDEWLARRTKNMRGG